MTNDPTHNVTEAELRQFIEQLESLEAEKKAIAEQQKDIISEAKARGYDTNVIKKIIALRKRDKDDMAESLTATERDAARYRWLKSRDLETIHSGGVFAGLTPENVVLNGDDLDRHIDAEMSQLNGPLERMKQ